MQTTFAAAQARYDNMRPQSENELEPAEVERDHLVAAVADLPADYIEFSPKSYAEAIAERAQEIANAERDGEDEMNATSRSMHI